MSRRYSRRIKYPKWAIVGATVLVKAGFSTRGGTKFEIGDEVEIRRRFGGLEVRHSVSQGYAKAPVFYFEPKAASV